MVILEKTPKILEIVTLLSEEHSDEIMPLHFVVIHSPKRLNYVEFIIVDTDVTR